MRRKILVIDDDLNSQEITEGFLKENFQASHEIIKSLDGLAGLRVLKENQNDIDVIILDRIMPIVSGIEFLKKWSVDPDLKKIPIVMQTAADQREYMIESFKFGISYYLIKPYSPEELNAVIKAAIDSRNIG